MIRRLALTAGFAILGTVAFAPNAHAQAAPDQETVEFTGTVESSCSFNPGGEESIPGELTLDDDGTMLTSEGSPGATTVICFGGGGTISVAEPMKGDMSPDGDFDAVAIVSDGLAETTSEDEIPFEIPGDVEVPLLVDMEVTSDNPLPAGEYSYDVMVSATPN